MGAVLALLDGGTAELIGVLGQIVLATLLGDAVVLGVGVDSHGVASVAAASCLAVYDHLRGEGHVRPGPVPHDVDPVSDRTGAALCPAAPAVRRNVLILAPRHVVHSIHIPPVPAFGQVFEVEVLVRPWSCDVFGYVVVDAFAGVVVVSELQLRGSLIFGCEFGLISDVVGPGVGGYCPGAVSLNIEVVDASDESEGAIFPPVAAP